MSHTKGPSFAWLIFCLKVAAFSLWCIWVIWIPWAIYLTQLASHSAASTRTWQKKNKTKQKKKQSEQQLSTCVLKLCTFLSRPILCKRKTWNHQSLRGLRTVIQTTNYVSFKLELNTAHIRIAEVEVWRRRRRQTPLAICEILTKSIN